MKGGDMRLENKSLYFTFGIDDVNVIEDDDRFAITKIRAFAEKENSHTQPISFDSLKSGKSIFACMFFTPLFSK